MRKLEANGIQLIAEGSSKLASVPSGGAGGAGPSAGGAAASGGAAAEEKVEEKEEGTLQSEQTVGVVTNEFHREGGVRRGYGFRSLRLSNQNSSSRKPCSRYFTTNVQGFWEELCGLCQLFARHGNTGSWIKGPL